jgi:hypothetical protein
MRPSGEPYKVSSLVVHPPTWDKLRLIAQLQSTTVSEIVRQLVDRYVQEHQYRVVKVKS